MRLGFIAVAVLALWGCQRPNWQTPVDAFRSFQISLRKSDYKTAWEGLSKPSRERLEADLKKVQQASGGAVTDEAWTAALVTGIRVGPLGDVTLKESSEDAAVVVVKMKDVALEQKMVREDGKWRLDLLPVLSQM